MAVIPIPQNFQFSRVENFKLQRATNILRSRYTGQAQVVVFPFAVWMLKASFILYEKEDAGRIRSFLTQLDGQKNTFRFPIPGFVKPMTGFSGNALANGAVEARASSFSIDGLTPNAAIVSEGDYFTVQDELKIATQAGISNGSGQMTISFKPPTRKAIPDNTQVIFQNPTCLMRAASDDIAEWSVGPPVLQTADFSAVEAVEI